MNNKRLSLMDDLVLEVAALRTENAALKDEVASLRIAQHLTSWNKSFENPPPKDGKPFLGCMPGTEIDICYYDKKDNCFRDYYFKQDVTTVLWFWQPSIAPPTEVEINIADLQHTKDRLSKDKL